MVSGFVQKQNVPFFRHGQRKTELGFFSAAEGSHFFFRVLGKQKHSCKHRAYFRLTQLMILAPQFLDDGMSRIEIDVFLIVVSKTDVFAP